MNELISQYYDKELNDSNLLNFEAKLAKSQLFNDYFNEKYFTFCKITRSIKLTKYKIKLILDSNKRKPNFSKTKGVINRFVYHFFEEFL